MEDEMFYSDYLDFDNTPPKVSKREPMKFKDVVKQNLLPFLPAKVLARFTCVSSEWNQWIKSPILAYHQSNCFKELSGFFCQNKFEDPTFMSLNANDYGVPMPSLAFLPEEVDIVSSSNGLLVCHGRDADHLYYICSPANQEWIPLPKPHLYHRFGAGYILAFEPSAMNVEGNYELICAVPMFGLLYFELYSSSTNSWTILNTTLVDMEDLRIKQNGFYMKGVAYWLTNTRKVIAIDVEKEVYEVIPIPHESNSDGVLTQIREELCYITMSHSSGNTYCIAINGGMDFSLKHEVEVSLGEATDVAVQKYLVLPCFDGEKVIILFGDCIYSFGINDQILREISRVEFESAHADKHLPYVNSLVHLH